RQTVARMRSRLRAAAGDAPRQAQPSLLPGRWLRLHRYTDTGTEVPYIYDVANAAVIEMDIEASMRAGALELCQTEERVQRFSESRATKETPPKAKSVRFPHEDAGAAWAAPTGRGEAAPAGRRGPHRHGSGTGAQKIR
ncbi:unnamed protein product, partial [Prorocentrum cordatum]